MNDYIIYHKTLGDIPVRNIYCAVRNYYTHAQEMGTATEISPMYFQKALSSLSTDDKIVLPKEFKVQYELEIVLLIHKNGRNISEQDAMNHVGGIALGLDLTDRKYQTELKRKQLPWFLSKSFTGSAVVTEFDSLGEYKSTPPFWLDINGARKQTGLISEMIFSIQTLISSLSSRITLLSGDLIFTGTPKGVDYLSAGDELVLGIGEKEKGRFTVVNRPDYI